MVLMGIGVKGKYSAGMGKLDNSDQIAGRQEKNLNLEIGPLCDFDLGWPRIQRAGRMIVGYHGPSIPRPDAPKRARKKESGRSGRDDR
jgi:hypothetical protein